MRQIPQILAGVWWHNGRGHVALPGPQSDALQSCWCWRGQPLCYATKKHATHPDRCRWRGNTQFNALATAAQLGISVSSVQFSQLHQIAVVTSTAVQPVRRAAVIDIVALLAALPPPLGDPAVSAAGSRWKDHSCRIGQGYKALTPPRQIVETHPS
jgi:hypothetical protein